MSSTLAEPVSTPPGPLRGVRTAPWSEITGRCFDLVRDGRDRSAPWTYGVASGGAAFLIGRGPSATLEKWHAIHAAGVPIMAVNDYPEGVKPRYWVTGDPPGYFWRRIWLDPDVMKFAPFEYRGMYLPRSSAYGPDNQLKLRDCPNTHYFHKSCNDDPEEFFCTPWASWGTLDFGPGTPRIPSGGHGVRSSMFIGLRLLYHLGYRSIFLLGSDFDPCAHPDPFYFDDLTRQLGELHPVARRYGLSITQASPDAHLRVFPVAASFGDALAMAKEAR